MDFGGDDILLSNRRMDFPILEMSGMHHLYQLYNVPFSDQSTGATVKPTPAIVDINCSLLDLVELCVFSL